MQDAEISESARHTSAVVDGLEKSVGALVHIVLAGLVGAGVLVVYWTMLYWVSGWQMEYSGYEWHEWLTLSMLSVGLVSIVAGIALSLNWLARARQFRGAVLWGVSGAILLALTFVGAIATVLDASFFGD